MSRLLTLLIFAYGDYLISLAIFCFSLSLFFSSCILFNIVVNDAIAIYFIVICFINIRKESVYITNNFIIRLMNVKVPVASNIICIESISSLFSSAVFVIDDVFTHVVS